jgi:glycosyltransferase involved in cell wall biosynthesis
MILQVTPGVSRLAFSRMRRLLAAHYGRVVGPLIAELADGADVIHVWSADLVGAAGLFAARRLRRPCVVTPFVHPGQWGTDPASVSVYRSADRVVALLDAERSIFADMDVPQNRVVVSGVCTPGVQGGGGGELRRRHGVHGPLVLFLGVRRPYKGHDLLLGAAGRVAEAHPDATFAFVGPGEPIRPGDAPLRIIDAGLVDERERAAWLDAADLLCLPSAHEIFPVSVIEAWSVGTPALVTDLPPLRELIGLGGGELLPDRTSGSIAASLTRLLGDRARLRALGEAGRRFWAEHGTPAAAARRHEALYEEVLVHA